MSVKTRNAPDLATVVDLHELRRRARTVADEWVAWHGPEYEGDGMLHEALIEALWALAEYFTLDVDDEDGEA